MTEKIYSIPQNAKLSTLFNNMFCLHRLDLDCGVRQFKYHKLFFSTMAKNDVAKYLISIWKSHSLETLGEKNVQTKVSRVVNRVQEKIYLREYENNRCDPKWIYDERNYVQSRVFDITNYVITQGSSHSGSSGAKRKASDSVNI